MEGEVVREKVETGAGADVPLAREVASGTTTRAITPTGDHGMMGIEDNQMAANGKADGTTMGGGVCQMALGETEIGVDVLGGTPTFRGAATIERGNGHIPHEAETAMGRRDGGVMPLRRDDSLFLSIDVNIFCIIATSFPTGNYVY